VIETRGRGLGALGLDEQALIGVNALAEWPAFAEEIRTALGGGGSEFTCEVERNGAKHYFDNYLRFDATQGQGAIGFSVNVTSRVVAENERRRHAHLLRSILRNLPVVAGRIRSDGVVLEVEGDGLARYGLGASQVTGRVLWDLFPQSRKAVTDALAGGSASFTLGDGRTGSEWSVDFFVSFDTLRGEGATFLGRDLTERRCLEHQLLTVTDAEQQRIGADLHDGLGQELTGLACLAAAMRDRLRVTQPNESAQADLIARLANEATVKSRALAHGLSPVQLEEQGLPYALEDLVYQCQRLHSIDCTFVLRGEAPEIDHLAAIHLYRIAQEAIHNAVRHGGAQRVRVALLSRPSRHRLVVLDDGQGFDQRASVSGNGNGNGRGLRLMNYRANMLGGSMTVWSGPGQGTRVYCDWNRSNSLSHEDRNNYIPSPDRSVA
jgi:signal transduction histidine kinase